MPSSNSCCNSLNVHNHKRVYTGIRKVTEQWDSVYSKLLGKYIYNTCRQKIKKKDSGVFLPKVIEKSNFVMECESDEEITSENESDVEGKIYNLCIVFIYLYYNY